MWRTTKCSRCVGSSSCSSIHRMSVVCRPRACGRPARARHVPAYRYARVGRKKSHGSSVSMSGAVRSAVKLSARSESRTRRSRRNLRAAYLQHAGKVSQAGVRRRNAGGAPASRAGGQRWKAEHERRQRHGNKKYDSAQRSSGPPRSGCVVHKLLASTDW